MVVQTQAGTIRLRDVAKIEETYKKRDAIVRVNGQEGLALVVTKLADANTDHRRGRRPARPSRSSSRACRPARA